MDTFWGAAAALSFVAVAVLTIRLIHIVWSSRPKTGETGNDRLLFAYSIAGHSCSGLLLQLLVLGFLIGLGILSLVQVWGGW